MGNSSDSNDKMMDWLDKIAAEVDANNAAANVVEPKSLSEPGKNTTSRLLKDQHLKMQTDNVLPLLHYIKNGTPDQQKDAGKALGYIARTGVLTTSQKLEIRAFITDIINSQVLTVGVAFVLLEALERIDPDAFWTLVMGWYGSFMKSRSDKPGNLRE